MNNSDQGTPTSAHRIAAGLQPFFQKDIIQRLSTSDLLCERATQLLQLLQRDTNNVLNIQPLDIFVSGHLNPKDIREAAKERSLEYGEDHPHLKVCSVCNAFVETEAARLVITRGLETDMDHFYGQVFRTPTDNDKWFGKTPDSRI
jgi:hypothetical protein